MPKTADFIEETKVANSLKPASPSKRGQHPNSRKNLLIAPFPKGVSGNPGGKNQYDIAREIARAVLENNKEEAYKALSGALLKGNAYVFKELAERGYGKLRESKEITHIYQETADADLNQRIADLERDLGLARQIDEAGRASGATAGNGQASVETEAPDLLPR